MKVIRRLCRRGHSNHIAMPQQMVDALRLRVGDGILVELTDRLTIELRRVEPRDLTSADISSMNFNLPPVGSK